MNINKLAKLMSDENKSKLITHFFSCDCKSYRVNDLCTKIDIEQSNMSKHLKSLSELGVLEIVQAHKERYYYMPKNFKKEWEDILNPMIKRTELNDYVCKH